MSDSINSRLGEHVPSDNFEFIPDGEPGSKDNPYTVAPPDFGEAGLPYGAFCRCCRCGELGRSTVAFDFYADGDGEPLVCETCKRVEWK